MDKAKTAAFRHKKTLNEVIEEALAEYLAARDSGPNRDVVEATRGTIPASPEVVQKIMEEDSFLDS